MIYVAFYNLHFVAEEQRLALKQGLEENIKHIRVYKGKSHISLFAILENMPTILCVWWELKVPSGQIGSAWEW